MVGARLDQFQMRVGVKVLSYPCRSDMVLRYCQFKFFGTDNLIAKGHQAALGWSKSAPKLLGGCLKANHLLPSLKLVFSLGTINRGSHFVSFWSKMLAR